MYPLILGDIILSVLSVSMIKLSPEPMSDSWLFTTEIGRYFAPTVSIPFNYRIGDKAISSAPRISTCQDLEQRLVGRRRPDFGIGCAAHKPSYGRSRVAVYSRSGVSDFLEQCRHVHLYQRILRALLRMFAPLM